MGEFVTEIAFGILGFIFGILADGLKHLMAKLKAAEALRIKVAKFANIGNRTMMTLIVQNDSDKALKLTQPPALLPQRGANHH